MILVGMKPIVTIVIVVQQQEQEEINKGKLDRQLKKIC